MLYAAKHLVSMHPFVSKMSWYRTTLLKVPKRQRGSIGPISLSFETHGNDHSVGEPIAR